MNVNYESVKVRISICKMYHNHAHMPAGAEESMYGALVLAGHATDGRAPPTNPAEAVTVVVSSPFDT